MNNQNSIENLGVILALLTNAKQRIFMCCYTNPSNIPTVP